MRNIHLILRLALAMFMVLACGAMAACAPDGPRSLLDPQVLDQITASYTQPESFGFYMMGNKVGWMDQACTVKDRKLELTTVMHMEITSMDQVMLVEEQETKVFEMVPPYRLVSADFRSTQGAETSSGSISIQNGSWIMVSGSKEPRSLDLSSYSLADEMLTDLVLRKDKRTDVPFKTLSFNSSEGTLTPSSLTLKSLASEVVEGVAVELCTWSIDLDGMAMEMITDNQGHFIRGHMGGYIEFRKEDPAVAHNKAAAFDLFEQTLLHVDKELGIKPNKLLRLGFPASAQKAIPAFPGQETALEGKTFTVTLTLPRPDRDSTGDSEVRRALKSEDRFPADNPRIKALVQDAIKEARTEQEKVSSLVMFTALYINDALIMDSYSMDELLDRREGDCSEHSRLFVTLARAAGIPAREVNGLYYMGDGLKAYGGHAWAEVLLGGKWHMVDPVMNQNQIDIYHLATGTDGVSFMDTMGGLQGVTARVLKVE